MAFQFLSNLPGKGGDGGQVKSVDASIIAKLKESGYTFSPTGMTPSQVIGTSQPAHVNFLPGAAVPVYQNSAGGMYIVDDHSNVHIVGNTPTHLTPGGSTVGPDGTVHTPPFIPPTNLPPGTGVPSGPFFPPPPGGSTPLPPPTGGTLGSGRIYTPFEVGDVIPNQQATITRAMWSSNVGNLLTFFTSSNQTATQKRYYYEVFNSSSTAACTYEAQFSVAYGHKKGSGSADEGGQVNDTPSRAIYGQYRLLCLEPQTERFVINGTATDQIYVINVNRARFREQLDEGNMEINLHHLSGSEWLAGGNTVTSHTGSNVKLGKANAVLRLIDDSTTTAATVTSAGEIYNIVSGSIENGVYNSSAPHKYGLMYPRLGIMVLDGTRLDLSASFLTSTGSEINGDNAWKLLLAMSGAATTTDLSGDRKGFAGRSKEKLKSTHFFVRVKNGEYNFSNNPTFTTGSEGDLAEPTFINDPQTYITGVGLYNRRRELLAVAKMSKALLKNFTREALIKVRLDF